MMVSATSAESSGVQELIPLRGQTYSFHISGRGSYIVPTAWNRSSLRMGISHKGLFRWAIKSYNHTRGQPDWGPGLQGVDWSRPGELSLELPGAVQLGEKHIDVALAISVPWHPVQEELDMWGSGQWVVSCCANRSNYSSLLMGHHHRQHAIEFWWSRIELDFVSPFLLYAGPTDTQSADVFRLPKKSSKGIRFLRLTSRVSQDKAGDDLSKSYFFI